MREQPCSFTSSTSVVLVGSAAAGPRSREACAQAAAFCGTAIAPAPEQHGCRCENDSRRCAHRRWSAGGRLRGRSHGTASGVRRACARSGSGSSCQSRLRLGGIWRSVHAPITVWRRDPRRSGCRCALCRPIQRCCRRVPTGRRAIIKDAFRLARGCCPDGALPSRVASRKAAQSQVPPPRP